MVHVADYVIDVPASLGDRDLCSFFRHWRWHETVGPRVVILDFSRTSFVAPWAVGMFAAYGKWLQEECGKRVRIKIDPNSTSGAYLTHSGLPLLFADGDPSPTMPATDRYFPVGQIRRSGEEARCAVSLVALLALDDEELAEAIRYVLVELLRNVVQHAHSPIGAIVHAVYFPKTGLVEVVVADAGIGIMASLRERYREINDDTKAVKFALQPHVSSTFARGAYHSMAANAGLGLFFIKEIVTRGSGGLFLASGKMLADLWGEFDGSPRRRYYQSTVGGWRGTYAMFQLRRERIAEFAALLRRCRAIAAAVRKDPTELKLDFLEEVPELDQLEVITVKEFEEDVESAERVREQRIMPALDQGRLVVLDFTGIRVATQSFAHALMYRILRDARQAQFSLSIAGADAATQEAIRAVAAYANVGGTEAGE